MAVKEGRLSEGFTKLDETNISWLKSSAMQQISLVMF